MPTYISTLDLDNLVTNDKDSLIGGSATRLQYYNFLNQFVRGELSNVNPNDYLQTRTIKTIAGTSAYALPSTYETSKIGSLLYTSGGTQFGVINFDAQTVNFTTIGQTITSSGGGTGILVEVVDYGTTGTLRLSGAAGTFADNNTLTGSTQGSATQNGGIKNIKFADQKIRETGFGSQDFGWWEDGTNLNITPADSITQEVYILRYLAELAELTTISSSAYTVIPIKYKEFARNANEIFIQQYRENSSLEFLASQRFQGALLNLLDKIRKTPNMVNFNTRSNRQTARWRNIHDPTISN